MLSGKGWGFLGGENDIITSGYKFIKCSNYMCFWHIECKMKNPANSETLAGFKVDGWPICRRRPTYNRFCASSATRVQIPSLNHLA